MNMHNTPPSNPVPPPSSWLCTRKCAHAQPSHSHTLHSQKCGCTHTLRMLYAHMVGATTPMDNACVMHGLEHSGVRTHRHTDGSQSSHERTTPPSAATMQRRSQHATHMWQDVATHAHSTTYSRVGVLTPHSTTYSGVRVYVWAQHPASSLPLEVARHEPCMHSTCINNSACTMHPHPFRAATENGERGFTLPRSATHQCGVLGASPAQERVVPLNTCMGTVCVHTSGTIPHHRPHTATSSSNHHQQASSTNGDPEVQDGVAQMDETSWDEEITTD